MLSTQCQTVHVGPHIVNLSEMNVNVCSEDLFVCVCFVLYHMATKHNPQASSNEDLTICSNTARDTGDFELTAMLDFRL